MAGGGQYIAKNSSLSSKNYGYTRWSDLMRATGYFEETAGDNHQPSFRNKENGNVSLVRLAQIESPSRRAVLVA